MHQQAYIDGYLYKVAAPPAPPKPPSGVGSKILDAAIPKWMNPKFSLDALSYGKHVLRDIPEAPKTFQGPHNSKFTSSMAKPFLKGTPYEFMADKYTPPKKQSWFSKERFAPQSKIDSYSADMKRKIEAEAKAGKFSEETKNLYRTDPRVRAAMQEKGWGMAKDKMTGYARKAAPWVLGGGGLLMLMSMLFRKQQQGAPPQQIAAIQNQIRRVQQQQKPMRLNLVGK